MREFKLTITLLGCLLLYSTGELDTLIATVLPLKLVEYNRNLTTGNFSKEQFKNNVFLLNSIKYASRLIAGPFVGRIIDKYNPFVTISISFIIQFISLTCYYFAKINLIIHALTRILDGISLVLCNCSSFYLIWRYFYKEKYYNIIVALLNMNYFVAISVAPYIGGILDKNFNYHGVIIYKIIQSFVILCFFIFVFCLNKPSYDYNESEIKVENINEKSFREKCRIYMKMLQDGYIFICIYGIFISTSSITIFSSTLPLWLESKLKINQVQTGAIWTPSSLWYVVSSIICMGFCLWKPKHSYITPVIGTLFQGIGMILLSTLSINYSSCIILSVICICTGMQSIALNEYILFPSIFNLVSIRHGTDKTGMASAFGVSSVSLGGLTGSLLSGYGVRFFNFKLFYLGFGILCVISSGLNIALKKFF